MSDKRYVVYIMSNRSRTIYTGVTNSLRRRVAEHKSGLVEGFTQRYKIRRLVYYESYVDVRNAIHREKEIKGWDRRRRVALIEAENPTWEDLAADWDKSHMYSPDPAVKQQIPRFARDDNAVKSSHSEHEDFSKQGAVRSGGETADPSLRS